MRRTVSCVKRTMEEGILKTGFRLIVILAMLYKKDLTKAEIKEYFYRKYNMAFSDETLKLDLNTLQEAGFVLDRGTKADGFKISLEKTFSMFKIAENEREILTIIRDIGFDFLSYRQILNLKMLYRKISTCSQSQNDVLCDFKFYNLVNYKIVEKLEEHIENKTQCILLYDSLQRGKTKTRILPKKLLIRNNKLYLNCYSKKHRNNITFRLDNIKDVQNVEHFIELKKPKTRKRPVRYRLKRKFYDKNPLENFEKVIKIGNDFVDIETEEDSDFFIAQRLLTLGKNCVKVNSKSIKDKVLKKINETLDMYN